MLVFFLINMRVKSPSQLFIINILNRICASQDMSIYKRCIINTSKVLLVIIVHKVSNKYLLKTCHFTPLSTKDLKKSLLE